MKSTNLTNYFSVVIYEIIIDNKTHFKEISELKKISTALDKYWIFLLTLSFSFLITFDHIKENIVKTFWVKGDFEMQLIKYFALIILLFLKIIFQWWFSLRLRIHFDNKLNWTQNAALVISEIGSLKLYGTVLLLVR